MFRKKPIYIVLLVIFSLLLCADITVYALSANLLGGSSFPSDPSGMRQRMSDSGFMPGGAQSSPSPDETAQAAGDSSSAQSGGFTGGMPGRGTASDTGNGESDSSQMPWGSDGERPNMGDFDPSQMQGGFTGMDMSGRGGALYTVVSFVQSWWIYIGIFCVLADALCIFMLVRISRKNKRLGAASAAAGEGVSLRERIPTLSAYELRRRKGRRSRMIAAAILVVLAIISLGYGTVRILYSAGQAEAEALSVTSATAEGAQIDTAISGTGTLAEQEAEAVTLPGGVEIKDYYVANGDTVEAGALLAAVDHTSVMEAIAELQDAMDAMDADIEDAAEDAVDSTIQASVAGRVKVIYAQEDTAVADTMYDDGALMLLSLDGLMAADIETDAALSAGDGVTVTLEDGTQLEGRVDSVSDGVAAVTITDDGTVYGETVTVSDADGQTLGTGTLYIHSELKVTGFLGTVSSISCDENDEVDIGDTLMKLTDTENTAQYEMLTSQRTEYEQRMSALFRLYQDGNLYASCAGTVSGIDEDSDAALSKGTAMVLTAPAGSAAVSQAVSLLAYSSRLSQTLLLSSNPAGADDATAAEYSNTVAAVTGVSYASIQLTAYPQPVSITDYSAFDSLGITSEMMTAGLGISPAVSTPVYMYENGAWVTHSVSDISAGDVLILTYDTSAQSGGDTPSADAPEGGADAQGDGGAGQSGEPNGDLVWIVIASKGQSSGGSGASSGYTGGSKTGSTGGSTSQSPGSSQEQTPEQTYTLTETDVMSITPADTMSVTITIDELDILSLQDGQDAVITLDALKGQSFTGAVTDIDLTGTNSGGSTKFTAVVTLDRTEQMIAGMNASVSITLSSTECAVTIPVAALQETGSEPFVYTSYDEEMETFGNPVTVTTGLSDGTHVEILSGLEAGKEIWYVYNDTINVSSSQVSSSGSGGLDFARIFRIGR